ncbi:MAG: GTPase Era, partial [Proteobacteria bacterium]|nr:GTPase Era [Pseudomonadota bacterium]
MSNFKSGFVTLIGRPNVGKSTLLNSLIGQQISITADKPQTTRNNIRGIINESDYQAIVLDTPGIHLPRNELHKRIVGYALQTIKESDLIFFITEPLSSKQEEIDKGDEEILKQFDGNLNNAVLVINKIDLAKPEDVLRTIALFNKRLSFLETVPISALKRKGTETLVSFFPKYL